MPQNAQPSHTPEPDSKSVKQTSDQKAGPSGSSAALPPLSVSKLTAQQILQLQRLIGNHAVQRLLKTNSNRIMRAPLGSTESASDDEGEIIPLDYDSDGNSVPVNSASEGELIDTGHVGQNAPGNSASEGELIDTGYEGHNAPRNSASEGELIDGGYEGRNAPAKNKIATEKDARNQMDRVLGDLLGTRSPGEVMEQDPYNVRGTYYEKENKDDWKMPEGARSLKFHPDPKHKGKGPALAENVTLSPAEYNRQDTDTPTKFIIDEAERASYEAKLFEGIFWWRGRPLSTKGFTESHAADGKTMKDRAIFVITANGKLYIADEGAEAKIGKEQREEAQYEFHHSTIIAGSRVTGAGEMWFENGVLMGISDKSGHYMWSAAGDIYMIQTLKHLQNNGIDVHNLDVQLLKRAIVKAWELLQYVAKYPITSVTDGKVALDTLKKFQTYRGPNDPDPQKKNITWPPES